MAKPNNFWEKVGNEVGKRFERMPDQLVDAFHGRGPVQTNPFSDDSIVDFSRSNSSYSGTDCTVIVQLNNKLIVLGNLETFSYSIFREKAPVRVLGRSHAKGYTAGGRTISGSMVFIVFDRAPLYDVIKEINYVRNPSDRSSSPIPDQLPPLDLILLFNNEYGHSSVVRMYGVEFMQEGQVHSINDLYTENVMQFVARDIDTMIPEQDFRGFKDMLFERQTKGLFVDNHLQSMLSYKNRLQSQLDDINNVIQTLDNELGRRAVAGIMTASMSHWTQRLFSGKEFVSRDDLNREKNKQLKIKEYVLKELTAVNAEVSKYEQNMKGWTAQRGDTGITGSDNLKAAPSSSKQRFDGTGGGFA